MHVPLRRALAAAFTCASLLAGCALPAPPAAEAASPAAAASSARLPVPEGIAELAQAVSTTVGETVSQTVNVAVNIAASVAAPAAVRNDPAMPRSPVPHLEVQAPEPLKKLLETYLDLARAIALPDAAEISEAEWSRLVAAAPEQAAELARTEGYFNASTQMRLDPADAAHPRITLLLQPGPPAKVGRLTLELQGPLTDAADAVVAPDAAAASADARALRAAIQAQWLLPPGAAFSNSSWDDAKNGVIAQLRAAGYAAANWSGTAAEVDSESQQVRLFVVADSGPLYRAGSIEVSGLSSHQAEQVRGLAVFGRGAALTEARLQEYQERLLKTGLFDQVSVSIDPDPAQAAHTPVLVRLKETPLNSATTSLGVSGTSGPRVSLEHSYRRAFGMALTSREKLEWGRSRQAGDLELATHADSTLSRYILGFSTERLLTDTDMVFSQKLRFGRSQDRPAVERYNYAEAERAEECGRDGRKLIDCEVLAAISAHSSSTWRRVDNVLLPTRGYTLSTQIGAGMADGSASARGPFARAYGRLTGYLPLEDGPLGHSLGPWYAQARLELGKVFTPANVQVPDSLRFRAGGDNSVRGYAWRTLAPTNADDTVTGGRLLFTSSLELARPLVASQPDFWGAVFIDAGRAADQLRSLQPALGYGLGLRWRSPVGPLSLDWAWGEEVHRGRLHLNVGVAF